MSIVADQRKKSTTQPSRSNVASQQQTKKSTKQNQPPSQAASQAQKTATPIQTSSDSPKPKSPPPSQASAKQQQQQQQQTQAKDHEPLKGFNSNEVDVLLSSGIDSQAQLYKCEHTQSQKPGPWAQKAGTMSTGKDFWLELRRQVAVLQRGESTNKGG